MHGLTWEDAGSYDNSFDADTQQEADPFAAEEQELLSSAPLDAMLALQLLQHQFPAKAKVSAGAVLASFAVSHGSLMTRVPEACVTRHEVDCWSCRRPVKPSCFAVKSTAWYGIRQRQTSSWMSSSEHSRRISIGCGRRLIPDSLYLCTCWAVLVGTLHLMSMVVQRADQLMLHFAGAAIRCEGCCCPQLPMSTLLCCQTSTQPTLPSRKLLHRQAAMHCCPLPITHSSLDPLLAYALHVRYVCSALLLSPCRRQAPPRICCMSLTGSSTESHSVAWRIL